MSLCLWIDGLKEERDDRGGSCQMIVPTKKPADREWTAADLVDYFGDIPLERVQFDPPPGTATVDDCIRINQMRKPPCELIDGLLLAKDVTTNEPWYTAQDLFDRLGDIPLSRIRGEPPPGRATEADAIRINESGQGLCELIDGVLVEKTMGFYESYLANKLSHILSAYVIEHRLGVVVGADGMFNLEPGMLRLPDVAFVSLERLRQFRPRREAAAPIGPDLAVEVISRRNPRKEMQRKLSEYFDHAVRLVWYIYPQTQQIHVFEKMGEPRVLHTADTLDGGDVLPGLRIDLEGFFEFPDNELTD
jgi:Uma2 family endonuclease